ncbi:hypothetical protein [Bifidobacterium panos]|uniref:Large polyvalent protein associated domain-containing protein n=1 Tax=Bifidobacterium panos TaxID=2675321 RepID=A0ABX1SY48_9BIFI|nr:hypothetical protein [Bifidobacterium sp. DSM 109963]NMN02764.1 hypothetical protein [Bifidobacterium sp. DSM 109963]
MITAVKDSDNTITTVEPFADNTGDWYKLRLLDANTGLPLYWMHGQFHLEDDEPRNCDCETNTSPLAAEDETQYERLANEWLDDYGLKLGEYVRKTDWHAFDGYPCEGYRLIEK